MHCSQLPAFCQFVTYGTEIYGQRIKEAGLKPDSVPSVALGTSHPLSEPLGLSPLH